MDLHRRSRAVLAALATSVIFSAPALAQPLAINEPAFFPRSIFGEVLPAERPYQQETPRYEQSAPSEELATELPAHLRRQIVNFPTREAPGTIVIDTPNTYLYLVLGNGRALRYGIGVGREGFTWAGVQTVARKQEWPDWHPPAEMIERQPYLPRFMSGGPGNPLGARAMYLGNSLYRIHGTNDPTTIGKRVSSGCVRLTNEDVEDLYNRVNLGAKVVVINDQRRRAPDEAANVSPRRAAASRDEALAEPVVDSRPSYGAQPYRSANPYFGGSASRIY